MTKETIMQYKRLQHETDLKDLWIPAMSKELHQHAQGNAGLTKGTNTIFFSHTLTSDRIQWIGWLRMRA
jgi:hypothetical protein